MFLRNINRLVTRRGLYRLPVQTGAGRMRTAVPRQFSTINSTLLQSNSSNSGSDDWKHIGQIKPKEKPRYQLSFTCKKCSTRSSHEVSKQAYHKGTVLIQCPGCKNRHLIADHMKIFSDTSITLEDILAQKGETMEKRAIGPNEEDLEWEPAEEYTSEGQDPKQLK